MNHGSDEETGPGLGVERQRSVDTASPSRRRRRGRRQSDVVKVITALSTLELPTKFSKHLERAPTRGYYLKGWGVRKMS